MHLNNTVNATWSVSYAIKKTKIISFRFDSGRFDTLMPLAVHHSTGVVNLKVFNFFLNSLIYSLIWIDCISGTYLNKNAFILNTVQCVCEFWFDFARNQFYFIDMVKVGKIYQKKYEQSRKFTKKSNKNKNKFSNLLFVGKPKQMQQNWSEENEMRAFISIQFWKCIDEKCHRLHGDKYTVENNCR